jgi:recombinational DNA repair ATPase RecF
VNNGHWFRVDQTKELRLEVERLSMLNEALVEAGHEVMAQRDEYRDVLATIHAQASAFTGIRARDKLVGIAEECHRVLRKDGS